MPPACSSLLRFMAATEAFAWTAPHAPAHSGMYDAALSQGSGVALADWLPFPRSRSCHQPLVPDHIHASIAARRRLDASSYRDAAVSLAVTARTTSASSSGGSGSARSVHCRSSTSRLWSLARVTSLLPWKPQFAFAAAFVVAPSWFKLGLLHGQQYIYIYI